MCIAAWIWQAHPQYPLLLLLNRDEYHDRPTKPIGWWGKSGQMILGGRDELAGGTWMGCTKDGRLAFLTNFREPDSSPAAKTRGYLPLNFLQSEKNPLEYAEELVTEVDLYNGFNLILADIHSKIMVYVSNRPKGEPISVQVVSPGLHVLSNAKLDTPWHKALRLGRKFKELLDEYNEVEIPAKEMAEQLMGDTVRAGKDSLPDTGYDPEWELVLSPIFVETDTQQGRYGTRSTVALLANGNGEISLYEKYLENSVWKERTVEYQIIEKTQ